MRNLRTERTHERTEIKENFLNLSKCFYFFPLLVLMMLFWENVAIMYRNKIDEKYHLFDCY